MLPSINSRQWNNTFLHTKGPLLPPIIQPELWTWPTLFTVLNNLSVWYIVEEMMLTHLLVLQGPECPHMCSHCTISKMAFSGPSLLQQQLWALTHHQHHLPPPQCQQCQLHTALPWSHPFLAYSTLACWVPKHLIYPAPEVPPPNLHVLKELVKQLGLCDTLRLMHVHDHQCVLVIPVHVYCEFAQWHWWFSTCLHVIVYVGGVTTLEGCCGLQHLVYARPCVVGSFDRIHSKCVVVARMACTVWSPWCSPEMVCLYKSYDWRQPYEVAEACESAEPV